MMVNRQCIGIAVVFAMIAVVSSDYPPPGQTCTFPLTLSPSMKLHSNWLCVESDLWMNRLCTPFICYLFCNHLLYANILIGIDKYKNRAIVSAIHFAHHKSSHERMTISSEYRSETWTQWLYEWFIWHLYSAPIIVLIASFNTDSHDWTDQLLEIFLIDEIMKGGMNVRWTYCSDLSYRINN